MKNSHSLCIITNMAPHYREPIFRLIDQHFDCAFYPGDKIETPIKALDCSCLKGYRKTLHNVFLSHFYWQRGSVRLVFASYQYYVLDGEPFCLSSWFILILARLLGKTTVSWSHGWYGRERGVKRLVKRIFFSLFSKLMIYNEYSIRLMEQEGVDRSRLYCIANSLDSDREKAIRQMLKSTDIYTAHFGNSHPTVIYCGRIQHRKKLTLLIDAIALLKQQGRLVNLVVVGKDSEQVELEQKARQRSIDGQLWMYGPCYDDSRLGELFYNAAVCVSPGNVGLTAIHALTFGCPVITHDNFPYQMPEFEAIQPGITGDFFKQDSITDLKEKIEKWISIDSEKRDETRQAAYQEIDRKWNIHYQLDTIKSIIYKR